MAPLRVVIADDLGAIRLLYRRTLENSGEFEVVGEAGDGAEAVRIVAATQPDMVLLDASMPLLSGLEAVPHVRACAPHTRILIVTGLDAERAKAAALSAGADGYVEKKMRPDDLLAQILTSVRIG